MFANKNAAAKVGAKPVDPGGVANTIAKMFKNAAPQQIPKQKRVINESPKKETKNQRMKIEEPGALDRYKYEPGKRVEELKEPTQFGISNYDNAVKMNQSKGLVELMKECLDRDGMAFMTKALGAVKQTKECSALLP